MQSSGPILRKFRIIGWGAQDLSFARCLGVAIAAAPSARAQSTSLSPLVSVCSGVSLPRSTVTDIIGPVNQGIVAPIQTAVNRLIDVTALLPIVGTIIAPVDIDVTGLLADAASGDPITLQVLDTNGNVLSPTDSCNAQADSFALATEGGIAIGGNQISGLGQNGAAASAGSVDAIAFGNNAVTTAAATGSVALGTNATANVANSVALGQGSLADRGAQTDYSAVGLSAAQNSAGEVSIGAPDALRQITNVAAGSAATDAATVGQVQGAIDQVTALAASAVQYDGAAQTSITLGGTGGTALRNVANGAVSAASSDAVNGSQLYATNQAVATNSVAIGALDGRLVAAEGDILALDDRVLANADAVLSLDGRVALNETAIGTLDGRVSANTDGLVAIGDRVTANSDAVLAIDGRVATNSDGIAANGTAIVGLDTRLGTAEGAINGTAITGLDTRLGRAESAITDNGNAIAGLGARLGTAEGRIDANGDAITALDGRVTADGLAIDANADAIAANGAAIVGLDGRVTANTAALDALDGRVTSGEGAIVDLDGRVTTNTGDIAANGAAIVNLDGRLTTTENAVADLDGRVTVNTGAIADNSARIDVNTADIANLKSGSANAVRYDTDAAGNRINSITLAGGDPAAPVTVGNLADGTLSASSAEAVNGAQLFATNENVAANSVQIAYNMDAIVGLDDRVTVNEGDISRLKIQTAQNSS